LTEDLVTPLANLCNKVNDLVYISFWKRAFLEEEDAGRNDISKMVMEEDLQLIDLCAKALAGQNTDKLRNWKGTVDTTASLEDVEQQDSGIDDGIFLAASIVHTHVMAVRDASLTWVDALEIPKPAPTLKEGAKRILTIAAPMVVLPLLSLQRLAVALTLPFFPSRWELKPVFYGLKLAAGYTALASMAVYWSAYANFKIATTGESGPVYSGWHLLGYAYAWRPTLEGTTKKGLQRIIGTALGGFSAWLGVIVCAWSYDEHTDINPYGLTAYLTVTTVFAGIYFTLDAGVMSRMGMGHDHGYSGLYFAMTQALLALEIFWGIGTRSELVSNRIVATSSGVAMAIVISSIPPFARGGDPKHTSEFLKAVDESFLLLLKTFADRESCKDIGTDAFKTQLQDDSQKKGQNAMYVLKDADTLRILPIYRVSSKLEPLLEEILAAQSMIGRLHEFLAVMVKTEDPELEAAQLAIQGFLQSMEENQKEEEEEEKEGPDKVSESASPSARVRGIVVAAGNIREQLRAIAIALKDIEFRPKFLVWY
jgi:hypothetical protein